MTIGLKRQFVQNNINQFPLVEYKIKISYADNVTFWMNSLFLSMKALQTFVNPRLDDRTKIPAPISEACLKTIISVTMKKAEGVSLFRITKCRD